MKKNVLWLGVHTSFILFFFLSSLPSLSAFALTPGKILVDFQPSLETVHEITLFNTEKRTLTLEITPLGDLAPYLSLKEKIVTLAPGASLSVPYTLRLPSSFDKSGVYTGAIQFREAPSQKKSGKDNQIVLQVVGGVASLIEVRVPYSGKALEASVYISPAASYEPIDFLAQVRNVGEAKIKNLFMRASIFNLQEDLVAELSSEQQNLDPGKRGNFNVEWNPQLSYGQYTVDFTFTYAGGEQKISSAFTLGSFAITLDDIRIDNFVSGSDALLVAVLTNTQKYPVLVESNLNLSNLEKTQTHIFEKQIHTLPSISTQDIAYPLDLTLLPFGTYEGTMTLLVDHIYSSRTFYLTLTQEGISASLSSDYLTGKTISLIPQQPVKTSLTKSTYFLLGLLLLAHVFGYLLYIRRKMRRTDQQPKERFL